MEQLAIFYDPRLFQPFRLVSGHELAPIFPGPQTDTKDTKDGPLDLLEQKKFADRVWAPELHKRRKGP